MHAACSVLQSFDSVYHASFCFTNAKPLASVELPAKLIQVIMLCTECGTECILRYEQLLAWSLL